MKHCNSFKGFMHFATPPKKKGKNSVDDTKKSVQQFSPHSVNFTRAREYFRWNHDTSTPHRSETNGTATRLLRRVTEGTASVLVQSCPLHGWWNATEMMLLLEKYSRPIREVIQRTFRRSGSCMWNTNALHTHLAERQKSSSPIGKSVDGHFHIVCPTHWRWMEERRDRCSCQKMQIPRSSSRHLQNIYC